MSTGLVTILRDEDVGIQASSRAGACSGVQKGGLFVKVDTSKSRKW